MMMFDPPPPNRHPPPSPQSYIHHINAFLTAWDAPSHLSAAQLAHLRAHTLSTSTTTIPDAATQLAHLERYLARALALSSSGGNGSDDDDGDEVPPGSTDASSVALLALLAPLQNTLGKWAEGEASWRAMLAAQGRSHPYALSLSALYHLGVCLTRQGKVQEALQLQKDRLLPALQGVAGRYNPKTLGSVRTIVECLVEMGRVGEARAWLDRGWKTVSEMSGQHKEKEEQELGEVERRLQAFETRT